MKTGMRLLSFILASVMLITTMLSGCGGGNASFDESVAMTPLNASADKFYFMYNPDRGFRTDLKVYVDEYIDYADDMNKLVEKLGSAYKIYFDKLKEPCSLAFAYICLDEWNREELSEEALNVVRGIFEYARIRKYKLYVSFYYNDDYGISWMASEENKQKLDSVCADQETILKHIDQLAPIVAEYKDCCFSIKNGFIGFVGEWADDYQYPKVDYDLITKEIVDKLCAPNGLYFSHRLPEYTVSVKEKYPDWENVKYIGFNNCAFYGEQSNYGWHSADFQLGDKDGWWEYICNNGAYFPVTGELYTSSSMNRYNAIVTGKQAILELAHHWHVSLSFWHCKYDCTSDLINIMETWEEQTITTEWLDEQGIIYDPNWFLDESGNKVQRNCYEFIRDHLGYKIVADKIDLKTEGGKIKASMDFKNYGFSAAFNLASGFAILDENYNVISEVNAGDPTTWYSHDPDNYKSTEVLSHNISAELEIPEEKGKYYVAFYLKNTQGVGAQLSNSVLFENECNVLYQFTVK